LFFSCCDIKIHNAKEKNFPHADYFVSVRKRADFFLAQALFHKSDNASNLTSCFLKSKRFFAQGDNFFLNSSASGFGRHYIHTALIDFIWLTRYNIKLDIGV